jgi:myosin-1
MHGFGSCYNSANPCNSIDYHKKPGKPPALIKTMKDANVARDDLYKSGTIHTNQGEPPNSISKPTPRGRQVAAKPITKGKLLRAGGPGGGPSKLASHSAQSRPAAAGARPSGNDSRPVPQPLAALNGAGYGAGGPSMRVAPPPPPVAAPVVSQDPMARALYDFSGQSAGEMSVKKDDMIVVVRKETNGKPASRCPRDFACRVLENDALLG